MSTDFKRYGWKCNETNLKTLPPSAPKEIQGLTKWLTLEGRRSSLEEWLGCVQEDGKIHGKFWGIGAWTHRMSHSAPNQANIMSVFDGEPKSAVEEVKAKYDGELRSCWTASEGAWLVGTDAESIQLRVLCHLMKDATAREAITKGDKKKGTDIHTMNMKALGKVCRDRDTAKTFIYAWLLGASITKVASILDCSLAEAKRAVDAFLKSYPGLRRLKKIQIPAEAKRGFFVGLDGRRVPCNSEHHMLAGHLQNGEAVIMKKAMLLWYSWAKQEGINFKVVDFVHDEWQTEVYGTHDDAERMGELQRKALEKVGEQLGLFCPLAGETTIGANWRDTH